MTARFLKLDSPLIGAFDPLLGEGLDVVTTGPVAVLRSLLARGRLGRAIWRALVSGPSAAPLVEGNMTRKALRLPQVYAAGPVPAVYGALKRFQAALLRELLEAELDANPDRIAVIYNGSNFPESVLADVTERAGTRRVFVENGYFPNTMQIDPRGLNGANSMPRDPVYYLETDHDFAAEGLPQLVNNRASKRQEDEVALPQDFIFVAFQVPSDMQVRVHSPWIRDMQQFYDAIREAADRNPDLTFVIKEHPSFKRSVMGTRPDHARVVFANGNVTSDMMRAAQAVITLNSTVGIEGVMMGKPVITLANACYNIPGLVLHADGPAALDLALAEVAGGWRPDETLQRQVVGWLWNRFLVRANKKSPPEDLARIIRARAGQDLAEGLRY